MSDKYIFRLIFFDEILEDKTLLNPKIKFENLYAPLKIAENNKKVS